MDSGQTEATHIDEWIEDYSRNSGENYAKFVLHLARLPATMQIMFKPWTQQFQLFCTFENKRYRCTGASRLGDVWLTSDFEQDSGYEKRVAVDDCSDWSNKA